MFIQHKQLKYLSAPLTKVTHLHSASAAIQLAFTGYPPQPCRAYLLQLVGGAKALVIVAFYLLESRTSVFFVPDQGEVAVKDVDKVFEEGYQFVESMGFDLTDTDFHLLGAADRQNYWGQLPITQPPPQENKALKEKVSTSKSAEELQLLCEKSLTSLGHFLASM